MSTRLRYGVKLTLQSLERTGCLQLLLYQLIEGRLCAIKRKHPFHLDGRCINKCRGIAHAVLIDLIRQIVRRPRVVLLPRKPPLLQLGRHRHEELAHRLGHVLQVKGRYFFDRRRRRWCFGPWWGRRGIHPFAKSLYGFRRLDRRVEEVHPGVFFGLLLSRRHLLFSAGRHLLRRTVRHRRGRARRRELNVLPLADLAFLSGPSAKVAGLQIRNRPFVGFLRHLTLP